ncbi:EF-hand domain-containing protein [Lysobacter antibioticus]|jgi:Ca2+-binding EF-hand superfamily protein|uniref:EF hand family protein n=1 Tax=Lysobacter antibioticus TaxID=84531 RepID=A0A0S2FDW0_LYSAN|nr:EF-hand domain-containing protein [Lysobacter antibioticus]ALN81717.1 EF hand family protein [Lysobacter antibioticus]
MNRSPLYAALFAAVALAGTATASPPDGTATPRAHLKIDANQDGAISREEAAKHPRLAEKFDSLDKNRDGKLDASERPQHRGGREHGGGRGGHGGIAGLDADGDGRISQVEAAKFPRIGESFAKIDRNRDGYLVRSELRAYHESERPKREAERAKRFDEHFAAADLNRDGKLSKLEVEEKMPRLARNFAFLDEDRDGFLSKADLKPMPHR